MDILKTACLLCAGLITMIVQSSPSNDLVDDPQFNAQSDSESDLQLDRRSQTARVKAIKQIDHWRIQTTHRIEENTARIDQLEVDVATVPVAADIVPSIDAAELLTYLRDHNDRIEENEKRVAETTPVKYPVTFEPVPNFSPIVSATPWKTTEITIGPPVLVESKTATKPVYRVEASRPAVQATRTRTPLLNQNRNRLFNRRPRVNRRAPAAAPQCRQNSDGSWTCAGF